MDEATQYLNEWQQAQDRYRAGVNAGYSDEDAQQMYLAPVQAKWDILKAVPPALKAKAATDLDTAHISFLKGIQAGYQPGQAADLYLKPVLQEWQGAASLPQRQLPKTTEQKAEWYAQNPAMQQEEMEAQDQISSGMPVRQALEGHPMLLKAPGFAQLYRPMYESAVRRDESAQSRAAQEDTPQALARQMFQIAAGRKNFAQDSPAQNFFNTRLGQLENQATNGPAATPPPSIMPDNGGRYIPVAPPVETGPTPEELVQAQHPDWTPDQVKLGVSGRLGGAITLPEVGEIRKGYRYTGGNPALKSNWEKVEK